MAPLAGFSHSGTAHKPVALLLHAVLPLCTSGESEGCATQALSPEVPFWEPREEQEHFPFFLLKGRNVSNKSPPQAFGVW